MHLKMPPGPQTEDDSFVGWGDPFWHSPMLYRLSFSGCQVAGLLPGALELGPGLVHCLLPGPKGVF